MNNRKDIDVLEYLPMIRKIAYKCYLKVHPYLKNGHIVEYNELVNEGVVGFIDALNKYNKDLSSVYTYTYIRVKFSIIDYLRQNSFYGRRYSYYVNRINELINKDVGFELAAKYVNKLQTDRTNKWLLQSYIERVQKGIPTFNHEDAFNYYGSIPLILDTMFIKDIFHDWQKYRLSNKQKDILWKYFYCDYTMKEIGEIYLVTESRISQIYTQAINKIKVYAEGEKIFRKGVSNA